LNKKNLIIEFLSFGSAKAVVCNLSTIIIMLTVIPTAFLERLSIKCIWKTYIIPLFFRGHCPASGFFADCRCPACGLTRGISKILHGDFDGGQDYNRLSIFVLFLMIFLIIYNFLKIKNPANAGSG
jgi:hypothetical protein